MNIFCGNNLCLECYQKWQWKEAMEKRNTTNLQHLCRCPKCEPTMKKVVQQPIVFVGPSSSAASDISGSPDTPATKSDLETLLSHVLSLVQAQNARILALEEAVKRSVGATGSAGNDPEEIRAVTTVIAEERAMEGSVAADRIRGMVTRVVAEDHAMDGNESADSFNM